MGNLSKASVYDDALRKKVQYFLKFKPSDLTLRQISKDTGLTEQFLTRYKNGKVCRPTHLETETLFDYFSKVSLSDLVNK